jgi:hypothetical protein
MQIQKILIVALVSNTHASYDPIAGYKPGSKVTSHNAIDLDQKAMEAYLGKSTVDYTNAKGVYESGGNSKPYAEFEVPPLAQPLKKGDKVVGKTSAKTGSMYSNYEKGANVIKVAYSTSDAQSTYVGCKMGMLEPVPSSVTASAMQPYQLKTGCFQDGEKIEITTNVNGAETKVEITPAKNPVHKAGRTLKGFSTKAAGTMRLKGTNGGCKGASNRATDGCPYTDFMQYYNYYGNDDYADKMVQAAFAKGHTGFAKNAGDMNCQNSADSVRTQIIKKGTPYMNAYMYAIREFEDAIDDCKAGCKNGQSGTDAGKDCNSLSAAAVHAWDEGVAFYTGSLEGASVGGSSSSGKMSYRLAEKRCKNFKTCGASGGSISGTSMVNTELFKQLDIGQKNLLQGKCEETRPIVKKMVALMAVPLIQGTLRYAYKVDKLSGGDKEKAEGAIFAAAIVPRVNACSSASAKKIMDNMKIGATSTSFAIVKKAFEDCYSKMEIKCEHVGGLWFTAENKYYEGAEPCGTYWKTPATTSGSTTESTSQCAPHPGMLSVGNVIILLIACFFSFSK